VRSRCGPEAQASTAAPMPPAPIEPSGGSFVLLCAGAVSRLAVQELADQVFQHHGGLGSSAIVSPAARLAESAPASMPMYCSPNKPEVKILSELSWGKRTVGP